MTSSQKKRLGLIMAHLSSGLQAEKHGPLLLIIRLWTCARNPNSLAHSNFLGQPGSSTTRSPCWRNLEPHGMQLKPLWKIGIKYPLAQNFLSQQNVIDAHIISAARESNRLQKKHNMFLNLEHDKEIEQDSATTINHVWRLIKAYACRVGSVRYQELPWCSHAFGQGMTKDWYLQWNWVGFRG